MTGTRLAFCSVSAMMVHGVFVYLIWASGVFPKGVTAEVATQETVMAAVGGEARLSCQLRESNLLQITWQKISADGKTNIASDNKQFGQTVNPDFTDKVEFKEAGLNKSSIGIRNITEEDEGCYLCVFTTFPDGTLTGKTCLQIYELHEPVLHVRASASAESVVSCSATGRPVPTVTLTVTQQHLNFSHHNTVNVNNTNGTVTVTATAVLSGFHDNSAQVGCAAGVLSGPQMETFVMIPELKETSDDGFTWVVVSCVCAGVAVLIIAVLCVVTVKRKTT